MGLIDYIQKIQTKSEGERRMILWVVTACIFAVILVIWISSFNLSTELPTDDGVVSTTDVTTDEISPLDSVKGMASDIASDIKKGYGVLLDSFSDMSTNTEVSDDTEEAESNTHSLDSPHAIIADTPIDIATSTDYMDDMADGKSNSVERDEGVASSTQNNHDDELEINEQEIDNEFIQ